ncbi:2-aminoethylphosphonate--pyruvate transaminase [Hwanghaeella sp.]|uniref:2-aminoethylphosphonate--pyruvate transaminase n=1 Tax=Hwanghaeella sp. TaxID=2605943 RepID=UPI003CCC1C73
MTKTLKEAAEAYKMGRKPTADEPLLLTPGPLTTTTSVKRAMLKDWGSWDAPFRELNADIRRRLVDISGGGEEYTAVPLQGSGTFVVEAMLGTFVPRGGKVLMLANGAYGERAIKVCERMGRETVVYRTAENEAPSAAKVADHLRDETIDYVFMVHCETTSGIRNPVEAIAEVVQEKGRRLLVDAMSAFGALHLDAKSVRYDAIAASANKCLEGVPGMGFVICNKSVLAAREGNAHSVSLDLHDQWSYMEKTRQWRFTPPTHVIAAFHQALLEYEAEGGVRARGTRYEVNCEHLVKGMRALGFRTFLNDAEQAPIIVCFHAPEDPNYAFTDFYGRLARRGYVIYPGKLTQLETFRVGCIGSMGPSDVDGVVATVAEVLAEMGVSNGTSNAA